MLIGDAHIIEMIRSGRIIEGDETRVGPVSYDLSTACFYVSEDEKQSECTLKPGDSAFVASKEIIDLPSDCAARVLLKNSRLRQGLALDAPLYYPGHKTRVYYRITNVSSDELLLNCNHGIAAIAFEKVDGCDTPYQGAFSDEFDFSGMSSYASIYQSEIRALEKKESEIKTIEKRIYSGIIALMTIFVGLFSLVNINAVSSISNLEPMVFMSANLATIGGFSFLAGLISLIVGSKKCVAVLAWVAAAVFMLVAVILVVLTGGVVPAISGA